MRFPLVSSRRCSRLLIALALLVVAPLGCEQSPSLQGPSCTNSQQCDEDQFCASGGTCRASCASCGLSCERTLDCPVGQYCDGGRKQCEQECVASVSETCASRQVCSDDGQCVADDDIEVMGGGPGDGGLNGECIELRVSYAPESANVVLLIDQSGSMTEDGFVAAVDAAEAEGSYRRWDCPDSRDGASVETGWDDDAEPDYAWRWNVVRNILLHPRNGVVASFEDRVRFGLALYSSDRGDVGGTCPRLREVNVEFGNRPAMLDAFTCSTLVRDTPTRESLTQVAEKLASSELEGPKVIVLATDGEPDTCECGDWDQKEGRPAACANDEQEAKVEYMGKKYRPSEYEQILLTLEAQRIHQELGIVIEVVNLGIPQLEPHLDSVAAYGGALGGKSIRGTSPGALKEAFQSILLGTRSCVVQLDGRISQGKEHTGSVRLDVEPSDEVRFVALELGDADGWKVTSPTTIELMGEACATIKEGNHELDIRFPCDSFTPEIR